MLCTLAPGRVLNPLSNYAEESKVPAGKSVRVRIIKQRPQWERTRRPPVARHRRAVPTAARHGLISGPFLARRTGFHWQGLPPHGTVPLLVNSITGSTISD